MKSPLDYVEQAGEILCGLCFIFVPVAVLINLNTLPDNALNHVGMTFFFLGALTPASVMLGFQILKKL